MAFRTDGNLMVEIDLLNIVSISDFIIQYPR